MSDGMTEGARDQWRAEAETTLLGRLADHVEAPSDATWHALREAAEATDAIRGGTFSGPTGWSARIGDMATGLLSGDLPTWGRLVHGLVEGGGHRHGPGSRLVDLSPFAGSSLVTYRKGRAGGDVHKLVRKAVVAAGLTPTDDAGYLLAVPAEGFASAGPAVRVGFPS